MAVFRHGPLELKRVSNTPQRLKPQLHLRLYGTTEVVPFHKLQSCPSTNSSRALPQTPVVPFHKLQSCPSTNSSRALPQNPLVLPHASEPGSPGRCENHSPHSYSFAPTALFAARFCGMILPPLLKR